MGKVMVQIVIKDRWVVENTAGGLRLLTDKDAFQDVCHKLSTEIIVAKEFGLMS